MRMLTLDPGDLRVETFTARDAAWFRGTWLAADTDEADCDTESVPPDCPSADIDCETLNCTEPVVCGEPTEEC